MKAAIVKGIGTKPVYGDFDEPEASNGNLKINVTAAALSNLAKMRAMGQHYSSGKIFPNIAGTDGVGKINGKSYYFAGAVAPYGSLAQQTVVNKNTIVQLPDGLADTTAAAIANPGMSSWAALVSRAHLVKGETVLINGATGNAGKLAIKIARHLGAGKVIAVGRNAQKLKQLDADESIAFDLSSDMTKAVFIQNLKPFFEKGVDVVLDYLWGDSALTIMQAIAEVPGNYRTRFVSIGSAAGKKEILLPSPILRSSGLELLGSGLKSCTVEELLSAIQGVFGLAATGDLSIDTKIFDLADIEKAWEAPLTPRVVVTMG